MILGQLLQKVALNDHDGCSSRSQNEMWQTKKKPPATFAKRWIDKHLRNSQRQAATPIQIPFWNLPQRFK